MVVLIIPIIFQPIKKIDRAKTRRATFANFIHLPGCCYCHVILYCISNYTTNIQTVHDCFIAPATKAGLLSNIYSFCLSDLIHPIHIKKSLLEARSEHLL